MRISDWSSDVCSSDLRSSPPCGLTCVGFLWRVTTFTPDTTTLPIAGSAFTTSPCRPLSLPLRTTTLSPFLIFSADMSKHLRRQADDLHVVASAQFADHRAEDTGADRLLVLVDQHGGVGIEPDHRDVGTADVLRSPHDDGAMPIALLHSAAP